MHEGGDKSMGGYVTIPIHGEKGSLEATVRDVMEKIAGRRKARKARKSRVQQAIQLEKDEDTDKVRNAYLVSWVL
jgi:hypothetical protein